jgi:DNA-binding IclR family transcriptional regulator
MMADLAAPASSPMPAGRTAADPPAKGGRYAIAVLGKALDLLDALDGGGAATLTELSARTGIPKATALRVLANLEERGFVERDANGRYALGMRLLQLGARISAGLDLRTVARPVLQALHEEFDETINLGVPAEGGLVYIDILQSARGLRMTATVGMRDDYYSSALGKAMMAQWTLAEVERAVPPDPLPRKTPRTLQTRSALIAELERTRGQGFAIDDEENEAGARCVAAPLFDHRGQCIGAISLAGPASRLTPDRVGPVAQRIRGAAATISARLGYLPPDPPATLDDKELA